VLILEKMRKILFILLVLPLFSISQNLQYATVSGIVIDVKDNKPLPNSNIFLSDKNCTSANDGSFFMNGIAPGSYILKVSYVGYQKFEKKIELKEGQKLFFKIFLKDTSFTSKEVQIKAQKEKALLEQPNRITVIKAKEIQLLPAQSINEIIDYSPGISMSNTTGIFSSKAIVTMRGVPANDQSRTLVLLDGIPLNKSDEGSVNWNMINKDNIAEIKIIKGPGPAKYGSGAMGGVIEMTSKKPVSPFQGDMSLSYGTFNTASSILNLSGVKKYTGKISDFYWGLSGFVRKSDGYITEPAVFYTPDDTNLVPVLLKELNTSLKTGCDFKNNQNAELQLSFFDDMRGNGFKVFDYYGAFSEHRTYKSVFKYSGSKGFFKWKANAFLLTENYHRIYEYMNEMEYKLYEANSTRQDKGGNFELTFYKLKNHDITAGSDYKGGSVDGTDTYFTSTDIIHNAAKMDNYAVYIQDEMVSKNKKIRLNAGLRYDIARFHDGLFTIDDPSYTMIFYNEFDSTSMQAKSWSALCPRLSAQYQFSSTTRIYFSAAKGFRAPVLDDMCRTGKKHGGFIVANPELKPELIYSYEAGADFNISKKCSANISGYYSIGKDFVYYTSTGDTVNMGYKLSPVLKKQNVGKVEIYGVESELKYELSDSLTFFVNFSFTHAQIISDNITDSKVDSNLTGKYLTDIPNPKAGAGITWRNKIITTSVICKYIGKSWINDWNVGDEYLLTDKYPDYFIFNIRFEKNIVNHFNVSLSVENVLNKKYIDSNLEQCPGRFITGSVKYSF
jgi:outer membrane receptor protein involved in Fe transport